MSITEGHRLRFAAAGAIAGACALALSLAGSASAATVDCSGKVEPKFAKAKKAFEYELTCRQGQGSEDAPTKVDAYSIVSSKKVALFETEVLVFNEGEVVGDQSFGCEGPFFSFGFGCNGKASLDYQIVSSFTLAKDPCSEKGRKNPWNAWFTVASDKINPDTMVATPTSSEPFRLRGTKCPKGKR